MTTLTGHFDGKVIVPDEPVNLPANERLILHIERAPLPRGTTLEELMAVARRINFPKDDLEEIRKAIDADCEQVDPNGW